VSTPRHSHRRYNPLLDEWVLVSPGRLERPWQGQTERPRPEDLPAYDPECALCPGNKRAKGERNPPYTATFSFENDFPALSPAADPAPAGREALLRSQPESGACRVVCFSPRHDLTIAGMSNREIRAVVDSWAEETGRLAAREGITHVQVFENKGAMMGASNPHPHCQIWATQHLPTGAQRRMGAQRRYHHDNGRDLLGDYLSRERVEGARIVCANDHWAVLVPFWAAWPFETLVIPARVVGHLSQLFSDERDALADILGRLNRRYDNLFGVSFPYSMAWHGQPMDGHSHPYWRLHASYFPPLLRSATVRKFVVGYELAAEAQRDFTPEDAAARLRAALDGAIAGSWLATRGAVDGRARGAAEPPERGPAEPSVRSASEPGNGRSG
jgi:UDPglucose--hexose-1-phosphate uridylyltransferase